MHEKLEKKLVLYYFCFYFSSFEQEENEMKMMSCIFDDEEVSGESSSSGSSCSVTVGQEQQQSLTKEKMNLKSRFIKKKPTAGNTSTNNNKCPNNGQKVQSRVQRSASAILRSKMYAVVAKKRKISKPTMDQPSAEENNIGMLFRVNQNYFKTLISKLSQIKNQAGDCKFLNLVL